MTDISGTPSVTTTASPADDAPALDGALALSISNANATDGTKSDALNGAKSTQIYNVPEGGLAGDLANGAVDGLSDAIDDDEAQDDIATDLDGETDATRSPSESDAIDDTFDDIAEHDMLDFQVAVVREGYAYRFTTEAGVQVWFRLRENEGSRVFETPSGERILIVSQELTPDEIVDAVMGAFASVIEDTARSNGVNVLRDFQERFKGYFGGEILQVLLPLLQQYVTLQATQTAIASAQIQQSNQNFLARTNFQDYLEEKAQND